MLNTYLLNVNVKTIALLFRMYNDLNVKYRGYLAVMEDHASCFSYDRNCDL